MKRTHALVGLLLAACVDASDDTQVLQSSASEPPTVYEANSALAVLPLDVVSCIGESQRSAPGFEVYESADAFRAAYVAARPHATTIPQIDFARYVVVASYLGAQPNCQTQVAIRGATVLSDRVDVDVHVAPSAECASQKPGYSFAFVRLDRVELPYFASEHDASGSCP